MLRAARERDSRGERLGDRRHHARDEQRIRGGREQAERGERDQAIDDGCSLPGDLRLDGDADRRHTPSRPRTSPQRSAPRCDARSRGRRVASRSAAPRSASARLAHAHAIAVPAPKQTSPCTASRSIEKAVESSAGSSARNTAANATSVPSVVAALTAHSPDRICSARAARKLPPETCPRRFYRQPAQLTGERRRGSRSGRRIGANRPRCQSGATAASASCIAACMSPSTRIC